LSKIVSFFVDVMTGIPSIVAALFVLAFWILALGFGYSGFACALALFILMLPTVVRATEEMLKLVPSDLREPRTPLGIPRWRTITFVVLPTALTGIVTGIMLAIARGHGRVRAAASSRVRHDGDKQQPVRPAAGGLPLFIYNQATSGQRRRSTGRGRRAHPDLDHHVAQPGRPADRPAA